MKKTIIILLIIAICAYGMCYIDYFIFKKQDVFPRLAIKSYNKENNQIVYKSLFYKLYYCKEDKTKTIIGYGEKAPSCNKKIIIKEGYYYNPAGLVISEDVLYLLMHKNIYTLDMINNISNEVDLANAKYVSETYGSVNYKELIDEFGSSEDNNSSYQLVIFPKFKKIDGVYDWVYDEDSEEKYCLISDAKSEFSLYKEGYCTSKVIIKKLDSKWCKHAKNSTLAFKTEFNKVCK